MGTRNSEISPQRNADKRGFRERKSLGRAHEGHRVGASRKGEGVYASGSLKS
jgi:hypothetical protein